MTLHLKAAAHLQCCSCKAHSCLLPSGGSILPCIFHSAALRCFPGSLYSTVLDDLLCSTVLYHDTNKRWRLQDNVPRWVNLCQ